MIYGIRQSSQFKKDFKLCIKRGLNIEEFKTVLNLLQNGSVLPEKYLDHPLQPSRVYKNCRELHIEPNWLLVYKYSNENVILYLVRTGTHSDLFR
jgi:mRNA interferase YafQ